MTLRDIMHVLAKEMAMADLEATAYVDIDGDLVEVIGVTVEDSKDGRDVILEIGEAE